MLMDEIAVDEARPHLFEITVNKCDHLESTTCRVVFVQSSLWKTHSRATERHLPYEIAQCYLPPDR